jgi:dihydroorotate dehydrogenase
MGFCYEKFLRPVFFRMDPERAHEWVARSLMMLSALRPVCRLMARYNGVSGKARPVEAFGLRFPNAVGLAAGFDKNAVFWPAAMALGFGHVEIGTVTHQRQPGNPRPRIFRYPEEEAVINRMGFNNDGAERIARRLRKQLRAGRPHAPLGVNIGKSKAVSLEHAAEDYLQSFEALADHADYFAINVSSPNTPDLRKLQEESRLMMLLQQLQQANEARALRLQTKPIPMLVKIAPDLSFQQIDGVLEAIFQLGFSGIIATNTTLARPGRLEAVREEGGLSGCPLRRRSTEIINYISRATSGRLPIIGVGGISDIQSAAEKLDAGASLVQIYTGMIYHGPFFPREIARGLAGRQADWWLPSR